MKLYCLDDFKQEVLRFKKFNSYSHAERVIIEYFFDKGIQDINNGVRLNGADENPYIKKRLEGSGGFRFYFYLVIKNDCAYLMYAHPKTGPLGVENISPTEIKRLYKGVLAAIKEDNLYEVSTDSTKTKLLFNKKS